MIHVFLITAVLLALAVAGLAIGVIIKGRFPDTHVGHNAEMEKLGITCAKNDGALCQGRANHENQDNCCQKQCQFINRKP